MLRNLCLTESYCCFRIAFAAANPIKPTGIQGTSPDRTQLYILDEPKMGFGLWGSVDIFVNNVPAFSVPSFPLSNDRSADSHFGTSLRI